ncbi:MAG: phosphoribosylformylglycinamidine synthase subunit PurS [Clostridia bacterium]|nr:phosphoribosylformylglycinamidine synthase subunit PurS [Clostridia bacterium]
MNYVARVAVALKESILDPQGEAVRSALCSMGYAGVNGVRVGKSLEVRITASDEAECRRVVDEVCRRLLANPITETYQFEIAKEQA